MPKNAKAKTQDTVQEDLTGTAFDLQGVPIAKPYPDQNPIEDPNDVAAQMTDVNLPSALLAGIVKKFTGLGGDQMVKMYDMVMHQFGPNNAPGEPGDDTAAKNAATIQTRGNPEDALGEFTREQIEQVFGDDETLTEEFRTKASTLFETAIFNAVSLRRQALEEEFEGKLIEEVTTLRDDLTGRVNDYLSYAVNEWVEENRVALEANIRTELTENFMTKLHQVFTEAYIEVPDDKIDLVKKLEEENKTLKTKVDTYIQEGVERQRKEKTSGFGKVFEEVSDGMSELEKERFREISESVNAEDNEAYKRKLNIIKEAYFSAKPGTVITEDDGVQKVDDDKKVIAESADPFVNTVANAMNYLTKTKKV